ncbi:hypothetical protein [Pantoea sp. MQR6]|uniref:hypothetical protein n=1 Tax=Pantoea TaxID=53335 RepID=UPI001FA9D658|nr:hypothetical protein [Pantoea sp. MQR6]
MNDKKMISIDQFNTAERVEVDEALQALMQKYRAKSGKEPDSKKEKELSAEAREVVMTAKLAREKEKAERTAKKPARRKKPSSMAASEVNDFSWSASVDRGKRR